MGQFDFLFDGTVFKVDICDKKSFSIDLTGRVKIVIPTLKDCLVIYERFKRHILCFELNNVEN